MAGKNLAGCGKGVTFAAVFAALLAGCAAAHEPPPKAPMPGSDRDDHGCIGSAGYAWCARTRRCERPWELAREHGFGHTAEAFDRYCTADSGEPASATHERGS